MKVQALVLTGYGINCERETAHAFELAGAAPQLIHLNDLIEMPEKLNEVHILAIPGGFSFGDDIASGRILANRLRYKLGAALNGFVEAEKLAIGICNGFQVMVKMGLLPYFDHSMQQEVTLTHNDSSRFEDRWVHLAIDPASKCIWTTGIDVMEAPVRHGEGKMVARDDDVLKRLQAQGQVVMRYAYPNGNTASGNYPVNPNGSADDIAGICDPGGRIFGLMPHPEAFLYGYNHPTWTRQQLVHEGAGLKLFQNAVAFAEEKLISKS